MKVLLAAAILAVLITPTMAEDYLGNMVKWERESRNLVPKTKKRVPKAESLVRRANALLKGDPTCAAMLKASKLLDKAQYIYIDAKEFGGDVRNTGRRVSWLEDISKAGKCRRDKASDDGKNSLFAFKFPGTIAGECQTSPTNSSKKCQDF
jgi:hypothetical protein